MGCIASLPAVRGLSEQLQSMSSLQWRVLLLDIHAQPASAMLDRFTFRTTPTYILYDEQGQEAWRANSIPSPEVLLEALRG